MSLEKITSANHIRLNKKLCDAKIIITAHRLAGERAKTPVQICYDLLHESLLREYNKHIDKNK